MARGGRTTLDARPLNGHGANVDHAAPAPRRSVAEALAGQHAHLTALLERACEARAQGRLSEAWTCFDGLRRGLLRHQRIEEDLVFPTFEIRAGLPAAGPTTTMRSEHDAIRCLLDELVLALREGRETLELERSLAHVLAEHNRKEQDILYPALDRLLSVAEGDTLVAHLQARRS